MAAVGATVAASAALASLRLSRSSPSLRLSLTLRRLRTITSSTAASGFNITFAPETKAEPAPRLGSISEELGEQLFIPWIVRDGNGNLTLQSTPPERVLNDMAHAKTRRETKKKKKEKFEAAVEPQYSKAARRFYNQRFRDPPQRLCKVLAAAGVASRRSSEELVFEGQVTVNGSVCTAPQTKVDPASDVIYVKGNRLPKKLPAKLYFALNKPKGYICSSGEKETKSVLLLFDDYLKSWEQRNPGQPKPRLFTVGRLDVATTGLIIVTNDGEFAQKLSHPSSNLSKEYIATIDGTVNKRHLITISEGTVVDGTHCTPDVVELLSQPDMKRHRLRIVVHEGRNREVRELVKNAGLQIHSLKRVRIGGFRLPSDLALGKHVELKQSNLKTLGWKSSKDST